MTNGVILKPKPLLIAATIVLALVLGAIVGLVFLGGDNSKGFSKEELFVKRLEAADIPVGVLAVDTAKGFCQSGNPAGEAALLAALFFSPDEPNRDFKAKTYIDSVVALCQS